MQLTQIKESKDIWEEKANKVLSHFNYKYPDEIDMFDICWRYGIAIKPLEEDFLDDDLNYESISHLKAFSIPSKKGRRGTIYLKPGLDHIEKKLILAEEFCHIYSHYNSQLKADKHYLNKCENQAKRMAAYLLMPYSFLKDLLIQAESEPVLISDIADYFLVTEDFARFRLELIYKHKMDGFMTLKNRLGCVELY